MIKELFKSFCSLYGNQYFNIAKLYLSDVVVAVKPGNLPAGH